MANDETIYGGQTAASGNPDNQSENKQSGTSWQQVAIGGVAGILMGAGAMYAAKAATAADKPDAETDAADGAADAGADAADAAAAAAADAAAAAPADTLGVAEVDQNLSFGEAFAAARAQVGPGGIFNWNGNIYNTYTVDEWNALPAHHHHTFAEHVGPSIHHHHHHHHHHDDFIHHDIHEVIHHDIHEDIHHHVHEDVIHHDVHHIHDVHPHNVVEDVHIHEHVGPGMPPPPPPHVDNSVDNSVREEIINQGNTDESEVHYLGMNNVKLEEDATMNIGSNVINAEDVVVLNMGNSPVYDVAPQGHAPHHDGPAADNFVYKDMSVDDFAHEATGGGSADFGHEAAFDSQDHLADDMPDYTNDADIQG